MKKTLLFFILYSTFVIGQHLNISFDKITTSEGLTQNTVTSIIQDQTGFMWIGTQNGLNRYDGYSFELNAKNALSNSPLLSNHITCITKDMNNNLLMGTTSNGLQVLNTQLSKFISPSSPTAVSQNIKSILCGSDGNIWVATDGAGIYQYNSQYVFTKSLQFKEKDKNTISSNRVSALFEDKDGTIWIGTQDDGLNKISPGSDLVQRIELATPNLAITAIHQDPDGQLWIGTALHGIIIYDSRTGLQSSYLHDPFNENSLVQNTIHTIYQDSQNQFWIGTDGGLSLFNPDKNLFHNFTNNPSEPTSISSNRILTLFEDRTGIIWIGTANNGLNHFNQSFSVFENYYQNPTQKNSLVNDKIWGLYESEPGQLWVGTVKGFSSWDLNKNILKHYSAKSGANGLNHNVIRAITGFGKNKLLLGTDGGGINIFNRDRGTFKHLTYNKSATSLSDNNIRDFLKNDDGTYWVATLGGLNLFTPATNTFTVYKTVPGDSTSISDNRILDLLKDRAGNLWLATYNGLSKFDPPKQQFTNFKNIAGNPASLSNNLAVCLYQSEDEPDILWVGTLYGLGKLNLKTNQFTNYFQDDKKYNVYYSIVEDNQGFLWFGTVKGLTRFNKETGQFTNFDQSDGIRNDEFNANSALKLADGRLFFGGISGITAFLPENIRKNVVVPQVVITSFTKYDQPIAIDSLIAEDATLNLGYDDKYISFEFAALDFTNPGKNQYKFKLEGFDSDWINAGNRRYASYTNLDGGAYVFRVMGSNNDGVWSNSATHLNIYMQPPLWATWWFQALSAFLIIVLSISFYKIRISIIKKQRETLKEEVQVRTKELLETNLDLRLAQKEKDSILHNVEEGFFLLNDQRIIQTEHSLALLNILQIDSVSGDNFINLLSGYIPEAEVKLTSEYLDLVFDPEIDEELISELNPLEKQEFNFENTKGEQTTTKFLTFRFKRIVKKNKITGLIVTVTDETEEHILSEKLIATEAKSKKQIEWLMGILHLDSKMLFEFMETTTEELAFVEALLENGARDNDYISILQQIARSLHLLKGNANLLDLSFFANQIHTLESKVLELSAKDDTICGEDFLSVTMELSSLKNNLGELQELINRLAKFSKFDGNTPLPENYSFLQSLDNLINRLSGEMNKKVQLKSETYREEKIPPQYRLLLKNVLIQLVRNSLAHGIERPEVRKKLNKPETGTIAIASKVSENGFIITYRDDGRGLQLAKLKVSALESSLWAEKEINSWNPQQIAKVIFTPGISSSRESNLISGRGVGMDLIQEEIKKHGGTIEVNFLESEFCEFVITLPLVHSN